MLHSALDVLDGLGQAKRSTYTPSVPSAMSSTSPLFPEIQRTNLANTVY